MARPFTWIASCDGFWRDCRAAAAAEMALVLPGIALIALNVTDLSVYIYSKMQVDLAAQEAVGSARIVCKDSTTLPATLLVNGSYKCGSLTSTMNAAAYTTSLGTNVTLGTPTEAYYCADSTDGTLKWMADVTTTTVPNCSTKVTGSTAIAGDYISVTATATFTSVFPGASVAAVLPSSIQRTAWMRLQ